MMQLPAGIPRRVFEMKCLVRVRLRNRRRYISIYKEKAHYLSRNIDDSLKLPHN